MRILGVIPARGGSVRVPRKNLQRVGGITLVERAIEHARGATLLDDFVVSTDDDEIMAIAVAALGGQRAVHDRRGRLGVNDTPMADVLLDALKGYPRQWDAVCTIQPTSPLREPADIAAAVRLWLNDPDRALYSTIEGTGRRNGAVYITPAALVHANRVWPDNGVVQVYEMPASRSLDINTPADLEEARRILGP